MVADWDILARPWEGMATAESSELDGNKVCCCCWAEMGWSGRRKYEGIYVRIWRVCEVVVWVWEASVYTRLSSDFWVCTIWQVDR